MGLAFVIVETLLGLLMPIRSRLRLKRLAGPCCPCRSAGCAYVCNPPSGLVGWALRVRSLDWDLNRGAPQLAQPRKQYSRRSASNRQPSWVIALYLLRGMGTGASRW